MWNEEQEKAGSYNVLFLYNRDYSHILINYLFMYLLKEVIFVAEDVPILVDETDLEKQT